MNRYSNYTKNLAESSSKKIEYTEGSKKMQFTGVVSHNTSATSASQIRATAIKPSRGMLDTGVYTFDGGNGESSAASNEVTLKLTISGAVLLQVRDVAALMKFVSANCPGASLDKGLTALGFDGVRLDKPYTSNASPWVVIYKTSVITKVG